MPTKPGGYGQGGVVASGQRDMGYWVAAGETGGAGAQQKPLWGGADSALLSVGPTAAMQIIMLEAPRINMGAGVALARGRLKVDFIDGVVDHDINSSAVTDLYSVFCGIYIGEYVSGNSVYTTQDPSNASEVSREWIYLEGRSMVVKAGEFGSSGKQLTPPLFNLTGAVDIEIEPGEALMLALAWASIGVGNSVSFMPNIRLHLQEPT